MPNLSISEHFADLKDPRMDRTKRHSLLDILTITLCGAVCGIDNWVELERFGRAKEKWFRTFLELPNGIPSHDTFGRLFAALDPEAFRRCFISWVESMGVVKVGEVVAIDGKSIRRSLDVAQGKGPLHMVNAWATEAGVALGQRATDEKSNEITAIPELLEQLQLKGCIVTIDAMGCQKTIAAQIREGEADYVLQVKDNHPTLHQEIETYFASECGDSLLPTETTFLETTDGDHGRIEVRRFWHTTDIDWFSDAHQWPGLRGFGMVEAERTVDGKTSIHRRHYITTVDDVRVFAHAARSHWGIENSLHWVLDMAFDEDQSRARIGNATENLAVIRQVALNLLKQENTVKVGIQTKRKMCGWDHDFLLSVLNLQAPQL